ncbi:MAG: hypothetical protein A2898_02855 [Candidatus Kerfeldbacteria bacterium RIFCSPLOWO2_01_FULL_48_11]|uniref:Glycosyltransferase 2-like domain-containing protein n=1 Tax=Candidatus Kerfeldbacteria bacterium RIFCSPLOWO2_01_FULL_48_11 TaxID=1798543 RepID=A0A1G2B761_9BACT|nr:MAG: Dolichol-phosphate mannose synthase [Parcubacteria group bacterium GW2011_GWA2_48_9]KKW16184.1 MAG: Dolichol-phosphate mannose synthase [Parcubacteria group bacterium GW2011_GWC2_49_9]OGY85043.1 MAG: hypothetical protein A2898_02855 [Candidatus Kerfeldbacteria bacterium RIFCSPLOWO2_01_FULL_48_11]HCJ52882.1 glycosyltransferase family 2 protein [Candidatus Kerfeldbacteria bacterium]HCM68653.1 glycosyltransferase family 2 protein [Candidatus Kerfeldbacteria bacterium]
MKTYVVIPAHNEAARISHVLADVRSHVPDYGVIVVDDGSKDDTAAVAKKVMDVTVVRHRINLGKGAALKTGCEAAMKYGADILVLMDADGQHKASDVPKIVETLKNEQADIVFGARTIGRDMPFMMMVGNKFLSVAISLLFGYYVSDTQSGFRAFRAGVYPALAWSGVAYEAETEMIVRAAKNKLKFSQMQIQTLYHDKYKGTTVFDGVRILFNILMWKFL